MKAALRSRWTQNSLTADRGCSAALILACLRRGWYPSWDAQNPASLSLAEKLGYHFSHAYVAYEVYHNGQNDS